MKVDHPSWCAGSEPHGAVHASDATQASRETDLVDVRLTLIDLAVGSGLPVIKIDFLADDDVESHVLALDQAVLVEQAIRSLVDQHDRSAESRQG
ncbi:hypothetical protein AB0J82_16345 [Asanoa sp. NPDC049518]|uniref:hypothetical protein n=1 Tax=unclassified Asanoa TaxID=2685164 RepID=UPI003430E2C8